ncbi:MAG: F0F1 ATP synthase subunit delta, partial [Perlucidibaca sp.]
KQYLARPILGAEQQADAVLKVCGDRLDTAGKNFISNLAANKRLAILPAISAQFDALRAQAEGVVDVQVTTAQALDDAQTRSLAQTLTQKLSRQVSISSDVDASLIGGVVIRAGDTVIDASVRGKLAQLSATLNS